MSERSQPCPHCATDVPVPVSVPSEAACPFCGWTVVFARPGGDGPFRQAEGDVLVETARPEVVQDLSSDGGHLALRVRHRRRNVLGMITLPLGIAVLVHFVLGPGRSVPWIGVGLLGMVAFAVANIDILFSPVTLDVRGLDLRQRTRLQLGRRREAYVFAIQEIEIEPRGPGSSFASNDTGPCLRLKLAPPALDVTLLEQMYLTHDELAWIRARILVGLDRARRDP